MRRWAAWLVIAAVLLAGRPAAREPDELGLVRVLGVDGDGPVTLTAVCGGDDQEENVSRGRCSGEDFAQALAGLPWSGGREELSLTSVSYLIVGEDVALEEILLSVLRDRALGGQITVWLAADGAAALLDGCGDPAAALSLLVRQGVRAPTAAKALAELRNGGSPPLPRLAAGGDGLTCLDEREWRA